MTIAGRPCTFCHETGGMDNSLISLEDGLEPVVRAGGWVKSLFKAIWGVKSGPS